jgi:hypothetical protein
MAEIGRVERPDAAVNAPDLLGRVVATGDRSGRHPQDKPQKEDSVDLHSEEESAQEQPSPFGAPDEPSADGFDIAV